MPAKFQIYVDQSMRAPVDEPQVPAPQPQQHNQPPATQVDRCPRFTKEDLDKFRNMRFYFDERKIYPVDGGEFSIEELNLASYRKRQRELHREAENKDLKQKLEAANQKIEEANQQIMILTNALQQMQAQTPETHSPTNNRFSIIPQSLQPAAGPDTSCYGNPLETTGAIKNWWQHTVAIEKFTVPIDQSQYIRDNVPTSTPEAKYENNKRSQRRMSRPSMGGSPTLKLSPITETSREHNSKSSSSSSALSTTPGTAVKKPLVTQPILVEEPDKPIDPNHPSTYKGLLKLLAEPLESRSGYVRMNSHMPVIESLSCFPAGSNGDKYLVGNQLSEESQVFRAQILIEDSDPDLSSKDVCLRVDQPRNDWMFYICHELHRRLVRLKSKPDIELSVMNADPALMFNDGSVLVDEYFRFVTLEDYFEACSGSRKKEFPRSVAAYITLELLQLVKIMQECDIIHMNIKPNNIIINSCPTREDISNVCERISIIKLIGFDYATDIRLLPCDYKFTTKLEHLVTCEMMDKKPWTHEVDWFGVLSCIYQMFFLKPFEPTKDGDRWQIQEAFKGFPTQIWPNLFNQLLNIQDLKEATGHIDYAIAELSTWIKANIRIVLREAVMLDECYEEHRKANNKSMKV